MMWVVTSQARMAAIWPPSAAVMAAHCSSRPLTLSRNYRMDDHNICTGGQSAWSEWLYILTRWRTLPTLFHVSRKEMGGNTDATSSLQSAKSSLVKTVQNTSPFHAD
jgi:hypothetical protein